MVLDVRRALQTGYDDLTSRTGRKVLAVLLVFNLVYSGVVTSFREDLLAVLRGSGYRTPRTIGIESQVGWELLQFELPLWILAPLAVLAVFAGEAIRFWAIQQFADLSLRSPPDPVKRLPVFLAVAGGFTLLVFGLTEVVPLLWAPSGVEAMARTTQAVSVVSLHLVGVTVYLRQELALTEAGAREAVRKSVRRFLTEPVPILGLLALLGLGGALVGLAPMVASYLGLAGNATVTQVGELVHVALGTVLSTFSIAAVTDAYVQIRGGKFR
ncbi:hypothetical protein EGH22_13170 [Halomicroarcula sp. F28]|uniref:hypothetical protein n=1 Tax=Haloarcula salinisoli TaxID=2487746 RepID=UPI001C736355|nr:hypothetical protein [Halomicroarcula salinisoli]MBX0287281.1 hypothetical protein [Halomicroarcula salinisoli]